MLFWDQRYVSLLSFIVFCVQIETISQKLNIHDVAIQQEWNMFT